MNVLHEARLREIDPVTLYRILALRADVFVVEQDCAYLDPDGRDLEADALQLWAESDGEVVATLRLLRDGSARTARIGRVATARDSRGAGIAAALVQRAIARAGGAEIVLDAQTYLAAWYARFGFERDGPEFVEDGIAHVPMRRPAPQRNDGESTTSSR
ncbi:MAG: GNAT family N-acetyltransferase [Jatrophihabitantaceae bacterium]